MYESRLNSIRHAKRGGGIIIQFIGKFPSHPNTPFLCSTPPFLSLPSQDEEMPWISVSVSESGYSNTTTHASHLLFPDQSDITTVNLGLSI
jgi:hypothetical protein